MAKLLHVSDLADDVWGVLTAEVRQLHPKRTFKRRNGGEGSLQRVTLADATGEIDLVLWDDEIATHADMLRPGTRITLKGATVKPGYQGGLELHVGAGEIEAARDAATRRVEGRLIDLRPTEVVDTPHGPAFKATCTLATDDGEVHVVCWGEAIQEVVGHEGQVVGLDATANPAIDGWFTAGRPPT